MISEPNQTKISQQRNDGITVRKKRKQKSDNKNIEERETSFDNDTDRRKENDDANRKKTDKRRYVAIIGDSIVKEERGHLLSTKREYVIVKSFSGATTSQMFD